MNLNKLAVISLALCLVLVSQTAAEPKPAVRSQFAELKDYLAQNVRNFKLNFHRLFEESRLKRKQKNGVLYSLPERGVLIEEHLKVQNVSATYEDYLPRMIRQNGPIRMWSPIASSYRETLVFWGHANGMLVLTKFNLMPGGRIQLEPWLQYKEIENGEPRKAHYFVHSGNIWLVVSYHSRDKEYLALYQFYPTTRAFRRRQTIKTDVKCDFDVKQMSKDVIYMAISSYMKRTPIGQTLQSTLKLYEWRNTQFDFIAEQKTFSANAVKLFSMPANGGHNEVLYMAVAQDYKSESRSLESSKIDYYNHFPVEGSPVLLYNARDDEKLTYVQIIPNLATKVEHFRVDGNDYLIFVDPNDNARIYWWGGDQFLIYQDLFDTRNAIDISVTQLPNQEILLAILDPNGVQFYTESLNAKYQMNGQLLIPEPAFTKIQLFSVFGQHYYSVFTLNPKTRTPLSPIWKLTLVKHQVQDQFDYDPLRSCLLKLEESLSNREDKLRKLTERADKVWIGNSKQTVTAPVIVKGKVRATTISGQNVRITNGNRNVPDITNTDVKIRADTLSKRLNSITSDMNNLVYKSKNQTIVGRTTFIRPINARHSAIRNIDNRDMILNGIRFWELAENTLRINGNQVITGHLSINGLRTDTLALNGLINNLNVSDALLSDSPQPQVVVGAHRYRDVVVGNNLLVNNKFGSINGIFTSHFVTKSAPYQQIEGRKVFQTLVAKNINVSGTINGKDLSDIANRAVLLNGANQVITGQWIMDSPISVNRIKLKGLINRVVNVSEIAFNAVTIYGQQTITGRKTFFAPVAVTGGVEMGGKVNGVKLAVDCITTNTQQVITSNLVFKSSVQFMNNLNSDSVNGIDLSADSVRKNVSEWQSVNTKVFDRTFVVVNDITMNAGSTIDGTDPSELSKLVISNLNSSFEAPVTFNKLSVGGNIFSKTINNLRINDLPNILWLKTVNQTIRVPVVFEGLIKTRSLLSPDINGFSVPHDFVHKHLADNEVILAPKKFDNLQVEGNVHHMKGKLLNGIDLALFERRVVRWEGKNMDYIRGPKQFVSIDVKGSAVVGTVNQLNISSDVLLTNSLQTINGNIRLMSPKTWINGRLEVMSNINVKTTVNNYSLSQLANDVVLANRFPHTYQRAITNKVFAHGITADHVSAIGTISGHDINDMRHRVVTLDTPQHIFAHKNFTTVTRFNDQLNSDYLNDLNIRDFAQKVVQKNVETTVRGPKMFSGNVRISQDLLVSRTINGIDVQSLQRRMMSSKLDNVIMAPMTFANDINLGHLRIEHPLATIDGLRLNQLALLDRPIRISGNIIVNRSVSVGTDINVNGLVNGCDLRSLATQAVYRDNRTRLQTIHGAKQFYKLDVLGNVVVQGLVNHLDINRLATRLATKSGHQILSGPFTFENDLIVDRLIVNNLINGKNISFLFEDAVLRSKEQVISSRKTFVRPILSNGSRTRADGYVNVEGLVNGVDVVRLNQTAVRQHTSHTISGRKTFAGRVSFKGDVFIGGTLNGIKFPNDLILVNTNELISGTTTFNHWVSGKKALTVSRLIDGTDLSYFVANRVALTDRNQLIESVLNLTNRVSLDSLVVRKSINNIPIEQLVTTRGRHIIFASKTFDNDLVVNGHIFSHGLYNRIDIHDLNNRAVSLVRPDLIPGVTEFTAPVFMQHMTITGLLNGYDIRDMANFFNRFTADVNRLLFTIGIQINRQENALTAQFASHLADKSSGIAYFIVSQEIYETAERFLIDSYKSSVFSVRPIERLILWTYKSGNGGHCRLYSSITYTISENGFITSETIREFGRNIPLNSEKLFGRQDFGLWTNTTDCEQRLKEQTLMESRHFDPNSGQTAIRFLSSDQFPTYFPSAPVLRDAKLFVSHNTVYALLAYNYDKNMRSYHTNSTVMSVDPRTGRWNFVQQLETFGVHAIDVISYGRDGRVFAAVANGLRSRSQTVPSMIMEWIPKEQKFVVNTIALTSNPSAVIFAETSDGQLYCVFANEKTTLFENECNGDDSLYTQPIIVYKYNGKSFDYFQSIDINGVISLDAFQVSNRTYIAAASRLLGTTFVLQLRGYNKFEAIQSLPTPGVQNVKSFWSADGNLHLAVASSKPGHSKILTAVISGPHNVKKYSTINQLLTDAKLVNY